MDVIKIPDNLKKLTDYVPLVLITLLFVAETELQDHALNISVQIALTIFIIIVFFTVLHQCNSKKIAITISFVLWIILVYIKNIYIPKKL